MAGSEETPPRRLQTDAAMRASPNQVLSMKPIIAGLQSAQAAGTAYGGNEANIMKMTDVIQPSSVSGELLGTGTEPEAELEAQMPSFIREDKAESAADLFPVCLETGHRPSQTTLLDIQT